MNGETRTKWATPEERNADVLHAALNEARAVGFSNITRDGVARRGGVATGTVNTAFGTMDILRDAMMTKVVEMGLLDLLVQGLAAGHPIALGAPADLKRRAADSLTA